MEATGHTGPIQKGRVVHSGPSRFTFSPVAVCLQEPLFSVHRYPQGNVLVQNSAPLSSFLKAHLNSFVTPAHPLSTRDHICLRPRVSSSNQSRNTYPTRTRPGNYTKEHFKCQVPRPQHIMKNIHSIHSLLLYRNSNFIRSRLLLVLVPGLCILFRNSFLVLISSSPSPIFYHTQGVWSYAKVLNQSGIEFCAA